MGSTEVSFPGLGLKFTVNPVAFHLFGMEVYWYGLIIALGVALCASLAFLHCKKNKFSADLVCDILLVSLPSAIVGARLYYVLCNWSYYSEDLKRVFDTRSGGLAVYGGVMGAFLGAYIMCRIRKIPFSTCADYCIVYIPLGQAIGRWGNFVNQEAFGTTTNLPWGMTSSDVVSYLERNCPHLNSALPVHPTFLYESLFNLCLFFALLWIRNRSKHIYETTSCYMIFYGICRFFLEGLRTDSLYIGSTNIRTSQLLSLVLVLAGLAIIIYVRSAEKVRVALPERFFAVAEKSEATEAETAEEASEEASVEASEESSEAEADETGDADKADKEKESEEE